MTFNGYSSFTFEIHIIKDLFLFIPVLYRSGHIQKPVGQGTFTMVDVSYYAEISYIFQLLMLSF